MAHSYEKITKGRGTERGKASSKTTPPVPTRGTDEYSSISHTLHTEEKKKERPRKREEEEVFYVVGVVGRPRSTKLEKGP